MTRREPIRRIRCAAYCRKSHAEGLDQDFNSLDAQRESIEAFVRSRAQEGWVLLDDRYDDGGVSGATLERPALKRLLQATERGQVDAVVVYRIDRLSRSQMDFLRLVELLEERGVAIVSVTESFDTKTPMGRMTLSLLMTFAQFEREVIAERIRDKIGAAKRKGKYTGGMPILGYDVERDAKRLVVNETEAELVRRIFRRFRTLRSTTELARELNEQGHTTKTWTTKKGVARPGRPWDKAALYKVLNNVKYLGKVEHKGKLYPGEHDAIVTQRRWDDVHRILAEQHRTRGNETRSKSHALLKGLIRCVHCDAAMGPTFSTKGGKRYRYYLCGKASKNGYETCPVRSVAAGELEDAVVGQLRAVFRTPEVVARTFRAARLREREETDGLKAQKRELERQVRKLSTTPDSMSELADAKNKLDQVASDLRRLETDSVTEPQVIDALERLDPLWNELFPAEQARIVTLLVERVDVQQDGLELRLRTDGLRSLVTELQQGSEAS